MATLEIPKLTPLEIVRFCNSVNFTRSSKDCWLWNKFLSPKGYGSFSISRNNTRVSYRAHRVSYSLFVRVPICENMVIDHKCRNRACVNPEHLREATWEQNALENSNGASALNNVKTHCKRGHEFSPENTIVRSDGRRCRTCSRERSLRRYHAEKNK